MALNLRTRDEIEAARSEPPLRESRTCSLSPDGLGQRLAETERIFTGPLLAVERSDGHLRLRFRTSRQIRPQLERLLEREAACCPFLAGRIETDNVELTLDLAVERGGEAILAKIEAIARTCLPSARPLRIGEVARRAGVSVQTLRYYERRGLLAPERRHTGQREYDGEAVRLVRSIKAAQSLGFSLAEVDELLHMPHSRADNPAAFTARADAKISEMDQRITRLQAIRASLAEIVAHDCDSLVDCSCGDDCPIDTNDAGRVGAAN